MSSSQYNELNTGFQWYTTTTSYSFNYHVYYLYTQEVIFHLFYSSMWCTWWWQNWRSLSSSMYQQTHWIVHSNTQRVHVNCSLHIYIYIYLVNLSQHMSCIACTIKYILIVIRTSYLFLSCSSQFLLHNIVKSFVKYCR